MDWMSKVLSGTKDLLKCKDHVLVGIDGRCAAGKTTFAAGLQRKESCSVIHMDDFFLRPEQRTRERLECPGGNVDYERFREEVMEPLIKGEKCFYRPYDCHLQTFGKAKCIEPGRLTVVEGSYSCHPALWNYYDLHVFMTIDPALQIQRIEKRNREKVRDFQEKWIPLEEKYFSACRTEEMCEIKISDFILNETNCEEGKEE